MREQFVQRTSRNGLVDTTQKPKPEPKPPNTTPDIPLQTSNVTPSPKSDHGCWKNLCEMCNNFFTQIFGDTNKEKTL